jgi:hypothetical protein
VSASSRSRWRRGLWLVGVLVAVYLVASAPPVAAANSSAVASQHTTDSDFSGAQTLDNVSVVGSGTSADVVLSGSEFADGFEDEPADDGMPEDWENASLSGVDEVINVSDTRAYAGSQSMYLKMTEGSGDGTKGSVRPQEQPYPSNQTSNISLAIWQEEGNDAQIRAWEGNDRIIVVGMRQGGLEYFNGSGWTTISTAPDKSEWVKITVSDINPSANSYTVVWETENGESGSATAETEAAIGTGYDAAHVWVGDGSAFYDSYRIGGAETSGTYISANHSASAVTEAWANLSLSNTSAEVSWQGWDGSQWQTVNNSTFTSSGNKTLNVSSGDYQKWRVNVSFSKTGSDPTGELHDEGLLFDAKKPAIDNASASPAGGKTVSSSPVELSVNVSDRDFATSQGDTLNVTFYVNGSLRGSDSLTSNGTASITLDSVDGGSKQWHTVSSDSYNRSTTSDTFEFAAPSVLSIHPETNASELINGSNVTVEVAFYQPANDTVIVRETSSGEIDLAGLPADQEFVAVASVEGYYSRRVIIESLIKQQDIYLLNKSKDGVQIIFELDDSTGNYPSEETRLYVEQAINQSGSTKWHTIAGDRFGASGEFPLILQDSQRYRLRVQNDDGDTRLLGTYTTSGEATAVLPIGVVQLDGEVSNGTAFAAGIVEDGQRAIRVAYRDPSQTTQSLQVEIVRANDSTVLVENTTYTGELGTFVATYPIPENHTRDTRYEIRWHAERDQGSDDVGGTASVGQVKRIADDFRIDADVLELMGWVGIFAVAGLTVIVDGRLSALLTVGFATFFSHIGVVSIHPVLLGLAGVTAVTFQIAGGRYR